MRISIHPKDHMQPITDFDIHVASGETEPEHAGSYGHGGTCTLYDATVNGKRLGIAVFEKPNGAPTITVAWHTDGSSGYPKPQWFRQSLAENVSQHEYHPWTMMGGRATPRMIVEGVADALGLVPVLYAAHIPAPKDLTPVTH